MKFLRGINCTAVADPGAPTTGAWVVGDLVCDSVGEYWRCTAAGTPGTWTGVGGSLTLSADREVNAAEPPASNDSRLRTPFTINYCKEPDAETSIVAWAAYADAAGTQPVDGTDGSPTVSIALDGGSLARGAATFRMVKGASNQQGQGVSYPFTIDAADCNKSLTVSLLAFLYNGSYTANAVSIWIYDVTNARLCPINSNVIERLTAGPAQINMQWSASNSTSYRLCIHVAGTDTTAYGLGFDQVYIGPTYLPSAPAMSDWQDGGTITITATTTNPTKGTTSRDKVWWRRVGDSAEITYEYLQTGSGTDGSGTYLLGLPAGLSIDTNKVNAVGAVGQAQRASCVGMGIVGNSSATNKLSASVYDATRIVCRYYSDTADGDFAAGTFGLSLSTRGFAITIRVPIVGWSGTTAVQPGSRYRWAQRFAANAVRVAAVPSKPGEYRYRINGADTAPSTLPTAANGIYHYISVGITEINVYVGPEKSVALEGFGSVGRTGTVLLDQWYETAAGTFRGTWFAYDPSLGVVTLLSRNYVAMSTALTTISSCYLDILVADDPVPVALAPAVHVEASSDAGQALTADVTAIQFEDEQIDTHGSWSGTIFTAPVAGIYAAIVTVQKNASAFGGRINAYINGALALGGVVETSSSNNTQAFQVKLAAGDQLSFRVDLSITRGTTAAYNWLRITRIGDA